MNNKSLICIDKNEKDGKHKFLEILLTNCYIDHYSGRLYCKKCKSVVHVDWYRNLAFCETHIFSKFGITHIEELYKINIRNEINDYEKTV